VLKILKREKKLLIIAGNRDRLIHDHMGVNYTDFGVKNAN